MDDGPAPRGPTEHRLADGAGEPAGRTRGVLASGLEARLDRWAADVRVAEVARQRAREQSLRRQAEEEASLAGLLLDLAERASPVVLAMADGRRLSGVVRAVGRDFLVVVPASAVTAMDGRATDAGGAHDTGEHRLVAFPAIAWVRPQDRHDPVIGDRVVTTPLRMADALADLAAERERVLLAPLVDGDPVAGTLAWVGRDVVAVRLDGLAGDRPGTVYVPVAAIGEVLVGR